MEAIGFAAILLWLLFSLVPLVVLIFCIIWLYNIKQSTKEQVQQNKEIISLLKQEQKKEHHTETTTEK